MNPQAFNRYSYVLNNPLKYVDPTGMVFEINYNWTSQDYMYYFSYGATAMPVEQTYQNMMNDPQYSEKYKSDLQYLHDAENVTISFGEFSDKSIDQLSEVRQIQHDLPMLFSEKSSERYYEYWENQIYWIGKGWSGEWVHTSPPKPSRDIEFHWEKLGKSVIGTGGIVFGTGVSIFGACSPYFSPAGSTYGPYVFSFGVYVLDLTVNWISENQVDIPDIPPNFPFN